MTRAAAPALLATALLALATTPAAAQQGVGQSFVAPLGDSYLASVFTGGIVGITEPGGTAAFSLYAFDGLSLLGAPLFTAPAGTGLIMADQTVNVGVLLTPGSSYAFVLQLFPGSPVTFSSGDAIPGGTTLGCFDVLCAPRAATDIENFALTFTAAPTSTVPEPGTWALLGTGLLAVGGVAARRTRPAA